MSYLRVNTDIVERVSDVIRYALNTIEEVEAGLRQCSTEMRNESAQFYNIPIWPMACADCETAYKKVSRTTERLNTLSMRMQSVSPDYIELEKEHERTLDKITARVISSGALLAAAMTPAYPAGIAEEEISSDAKKLEQELSNTVISMEIANLAAVSRVIEEEYSTEKVMPLGPMTYVEPAKKSDDEEE